jgi:hypothetical protein
VFDWLPWIVLALGAVALLFLYFYDDGNGKK